MSFSVAGRGLDYLYFVDCALGLLLSGLLSLRLFLRVALSFDHADSLSVEIRADPCSLLDVVVTLEEFVELSQAAAKVLHADAAILIEIKAQVIIVHEDLDIGVSSSDISNQFFLALTEHIDEHSDKVRSFVIEDNDLLWKFSNSLYDLLTLAFDSFILLDIIYVRVSKLICSAGLDVLQSLATLVQP